MSTTIDESLPKNAFSEWVKSLNPEPFYRRGARRLIHWLYDVEFIGFEKIPETGPVLLIANHVSYMDGLLINAASHRPARFIIDDVIYSLPVVNHFMTLDRAIPIAPNRESVQKALEAVSEGLREGDMVCIFPEGQLTYTGHLGYFKPGVEWILQKTPAPIYPIAIKGMWGSIFSRKHRHSLFRIIPRSFRRKVTVRLGEPIMPDGTKAKQLQKVLLELKQSLNDGNDRE